MRSTFVRCTLTLSAVALLLAACDVEGRIEGFPTDNPLGDVESVEVTPDTTRISVGETRQLNATALDADGDPVVGVDFIWESLDQAFASVDNSGVVEGLTPATARIRASAGAVASDTAVVIVESDG